MIVGAVGTSGAIQKRTATPLAQSSFWAQEVPILRALKVPTKATEPPAWVQIAGPPIDPINLMIPLDPAFAARLARMHGQLLEKVRRGAEEKALLKRHHPPVNVVGGYRFRNAPEIELSLAEPDSEPRKTWPPQWKLPQQSNSARFL
jgi:hypothetical protein